MSESRVTRIIQGYWDCPFCDSKAINGKLRECPHCGRPRSNTTKFYMLQDKRELAKEQDISKHQPDWYCEFCDSYNSYKDSVCKSCGAPRESKNKDYFAKQKELEKELEEKNLKESEEISYQKHSYTDHSYVEQPSYINNNRDSVKTPNNLFDRLSSFELPDLSWLKWVLLFGAIFAVLFAVFVPKTRTIDVTSKKWVYSVNIEEKRLVEENDWSLPAGYVDVVQKKQEIHHYDSVLDHYETVEVQKSRQVQDGYDITYTYEDLGDGTFAEIEHKTPRYKTEYYTETEQKPVYISVPVYKTKYYYTIYKWLYERSEKTSGSTNNMYFAKVNLSENERIGSNTKYFEVSGKVKNKKKTYSCSEEIFKKIKPQSTIKVKIQFNQIVKIID